jgi:hypothetical protein
MEPFRWRSLSNLDGSERGFMERVRAPDSKFPFLLLTLAFVLPIGFGFLMIPFAVLPMLTEAVLGPQSAVTQGLYVVSSYALKLITYALVITFLGMYGLRGYVALKLRRQKSV